MKDKKRYTLTWQRTNSKGVVLDTWTTEVESYTEPKVGEGRVLLLAPPQYETITHVKEDKL